MSRETIANHVIDELIDIAGAKRSGVTAFALTTPTRKRRGKVTAEGASGDNGERVLLLVLPIIVSHEGVIVREYTNIWQVGNT